MNNEPLTLKMSQEMAVRAVEKANELGIAVVFATVDQGGNTILLHRMEGAFIGSIDIALNKAYTANAFQMSTKTLGENSIVGGSLYGIEASNNGRIVIFGGGIPYLQNGVVAGGLGVSGGSVEEDMAIVHYALGNNE